MSEAALTTTMTTTPEKVKSMIEACSAASMHVIQELIAEQPMYACQQDEETGASPLMAAAAVGNGALCQYLLEAGAPWNAVDRHGQCAGNFATSSQHWGVVNLLVEWGTRAELILGAVERSLRSPQDSGNYTNGDSSGPVEHQPSTKPDYLRQRLHYTADGQALLDSDKDAVMMEWERPLMKAHAQILLEEAPRRRVMNIGFGMGIIDSALQELQPELHIIVEAHPDVHRRMLADGWDKKPNVRICFGKWQDCLPELIAQGVEVDGIFYDTVRLTVSSPCHCGFWQFY
jgi:protein arginine N-methyltransferase 2